MEVVSLYIMVAYDRWSLNISGHKDRFDSKELHAT